MNKGSFIIYTDYADAMEDWTDEEAGIFLKALMQYAQTNKVPAIKNRVVKSVFNLARKQMDKDAQKWAETVAKRKEAGRKGGEASASKRKQTQANESKGKQAQANQADNDNVNVNVNSINVINNKGRSAPNFKKPTIEDVKSYCEERRNGIDAQSFIDFYDARGWKLTKGVGMKDWKAAIRTWEKNRKSNAQKVKPPERDYDFDALELKLLNSN